jgi:hypothetical protein
MPVRRGREEEGRGGRGREDASVRSRIRNDRRARAAAEIEANGRGERRAARSSERCAASKMAGGARGVARYGSGRVVGADFAERKGCQHICGSAPVTITSSSSSPAAASGARIWRLTVTSSTSGSACIAGASSSLLSSSSTTSMSTMARARTRNSGRAANTGETALRIRDECDFRKTCVHHHRP